MAASVGRPPWLDRPIPVVSAAKAVIIIIITVVMLYPFLYIIAMSFAAKDSSMSGFWPTAFSADSYRSILGGGVVTRALLVSGFVTFMGTLLSLAFTSTLAYGLTRVRDVPGARVALILVLATMFFGAGIIPNFLLIKSLGLIDSLWSLILPGMVSAFNLVVMRNFFMNIPVGLLEAARIDGASNFRIFAQIVLPLSKPVMAVIGLFYAVGYWNSYFNALIYISTPDKWPIQVVLNQYVIQGSQIARLQATDIPTPPAQSIQMAVVVLATVPILIIYPFLQRHFAKGMLTGAIKE
ncbi:carbohydrate ABC transporter permease [Microlunatus soli]|uniref:Carbohydrate ABC transporter membrane protein 2, CUT1 family n=1 Tax=Microlunatus soli TaxID=630515 RepID=A0A1H1YNW3_9ACTN|nr:carbohydrate ABC transporter permease [Microlunatus soli]SDT23114.1 carbohydrate ABC transporter membrane protein 2, CUT1 family [Microlunatus soli]